MNKTFNYFLLCCLTLVVSLFTLSSSAYAQRAPLETVPYTLCPPHIHDQMSDIAQRNAEIDKMIIDTQMDESNDPSLISLSCLEADIDRMIADAEEILSMSSAGWGAVFKTFLQKAKQKAKSEITKQAKKFACENVKNFINNQIQNCFDFRLIERQSASRTGNQQCIISANASVTLNRHGFLYTGASAEGSITGPGGLDESVLLGVDAAAGLESLYTDWNDGSTNTYTRETESCEELDPSIVAAHTPDYYYNLDAGEFPENTVRDADGNIVYTTARTFIPDGSRTAISYETKASCYGFTEKLPYFPCGVEDDGVTPAACLDTSACCALPTAAECAAEYALLEAERASAGEESQPQLPMCETGCCNIETEDCSRSGFDAICPCNAGDLSTFVGGECIVGKEACCDGNNNDCELYTDGAGNLTYPYCEGTEPEVIDCDVELDNILDQMELTKEQQIARCPLDVVTTAVEEIMARCSATPRLLCYADFNKFNGKRFCRRADRKCRISSYGSGLGDNYSEGLKDFILDKCSTVIQNQDVWDNVDEEVMDTCSFNPSDYGEFLTPSEGSGLEPIDEDGIPEPTPIDDPTPTTTPVTTTITPVTTTTPATRTRTTTPVPTTTVPTPTRTPSASGTTSGGSSGSAIDSLF